MREVLVFISYRQDDGMGCARYLRDALHGRSIVVKFHGVALPACISIYFDQTTPPDGDWIAQQEKALKRTRLFILVCSPGIMHEFDNDSAYREMRWWVQNRPAVSPILVTPVSARWVPDLVKGKWPHAQVVNVDKTVRPGASEGIIRILSAIAGGFGYEPEASHDGRSDHAGTSEGTNIPGLYTWEKDKHFRYIRCNENYARAAGFDSPAAMIGKSDDDMPWHALADFFRRGDQGVIDGRGPPRLHVQEKEIMVDRSADILVCENQLLDTRGECVGVTGYFIDITGHTLVPRGPSDVGADGGLPLGQEFANQNLTPSEVNVFRGILKGYNAPRITAELKLRRTEVDAHIRSLKRILQCRTHGDVIATAVRSGLPLTLFGPDTLLTTKEKGSI